MFLRVIIRGVGSFLTAFAFCLPVKAITLDWNGVSWTAGTFSQAYDIDPMRPGNDITLTVGGDTGRLIPDSVAPMEQTPSLVTSLDGGLPPGERTLLLHLNLSTQAEAVSLTVAFSAQYTLGVQNVSFTIFDVDWGSASFQDELRNIRALSVDGFTLIAPTITTSLSNSVSGSGLSQVVDGQTNAPNTGAGSETGNVTISFGSNAIRSFTLLYGSGTNAPLDPGTQKIGFHDISFTPVPEIDPVWASCISCVLAAGLVLVHRRRSRRPPL